MTLLEHVEVSCWDEVLDNPASVWLNRHENSLAFTIQVGTGLRQIEIEHPFTHTIRRTIVPEEGAWRLQFARVAGSPYADQCVRFPEDAAQVLRDMLGRVCQTGGQH